MPVHDRTRGEAGSFRAFHHGWIRMISTALNDGLDVLTLEEPDAVKGAAHPAAETGARLEAGAGRSP